MAVKKPEPKRTSAPQAQPRAERTKESPLPPKAPPGIPIDPKMLRRNRPPKDEDDQPELPQSVSAGPIDKVIELAFNPSREKIREVTIIDRLQGRLFPIMDMMSTLFHACIEVASYRQDKEAYRQVFKRPRPEPPNLIDELIYRSAQWQKSVAGKNLDKATDIALAETETRATEEEEPISGRGYEE